MPGVVGVVCPQCEHPCAETHKFCPVCGFPISEVVHKTEDPLIGTTLPGGYVILELVGVGGMGRVYRAEQKALGRTVAVKIIHPHLLGDESASARFITEARASSRLNHPNSVGVIDFGKNGGQLYLVMEFLRGRDLARVMYEDGLLSATRIVDVMCQVLAALDEAHHLGIIHRDLKPENIVLEPMRSGGDFVKVVDFGLAKMRAEVATNITTPGLVCGTPDYMAPEQGRGDPIDARSDLYSCGVILFQLLTGRLPFEAESPTQVVLMHISSPAPSPARVAPDRDIPQALADVTLRALAKSAGDRYQTAEELSQALKNAQATFERVSFIPGSVAGIGGPMSPDHAVRCDSCGANVPLGQKFCGDCGARVTQAPLHVSQRPLRLDPTLPPAAADTNLPLPFTERDEDLDWLDLCRFDLGSSLVVARLIGEHGAGKTRLLDEFLERARESGDLVVETGRDPYWAEVGYYAVRHAIVGLADLPPSGGTPTDWGSSTPEARRGLEEIFGHTERRHESHPPWATDQNEMSLEDRRFIAAEALRWAIARAHRTADKNRVILAIDDLQAIDGASRNAFFDVINEPPLVGMLIVATHLPDFDPEWGGQSRKLAGFSEDTVEALAPGIVHPMTNGASNPDRTLVPMHVVELIRFAAEGGTEPPARLGDLIAHRIERLPPHARRVLQALAVLGDATKMELLLEVVNAASSTQSIISVQMEKTVEILAAAGFVERHEECVGTTHPLIRDVMLAMIPRGVRRELHARAYADVEGNARDLPTEVLSLHAYHAQQSFEALMLLDIAANRANARGDLNGAILALRRGIELARLEISRGELDDPERAILLFSRRLGEALARQRAYNDATGVLLEALDLVGPSGPERAHVLGTLAFVAHRRARETEAKRHLDQAIVIAKESLQGDLVDSLERARRDWKLA